MMMQNVAKIEWKDYTESIPAFLIIIGIPLSYSIADGLALGFISYAIIKAFSGRGREISWLTYVLAIVLMLYFVSVRSRMGQPIIGSLATASANSSSFLRFWSKRERRGRA
jgi:adenine/guanine/hypoxanthine permease